ncbi:MAG: hypothetical protein E7A46_06660 [Finegoldia magna]|nr:B12-binding domain-containing protein [Finegoldia magna]MDU1009644.1 hypothetical protein [Finegoldia magna]MDU1087801.1 hypothetical protein [Finegoldia magna]
MDTQQEYLDKMAEMVVEMEDEDIADVCQEYIDKGFDPKEGIFDGLIKGMQQASFLMKKNISLQIFCFAVMPCMLVWTFYKNT